jgi:hypothetical protein
MLLAHRFGMTERSKKTKAAPSSREHSPAADAGGADADQRAAQAEHDRLDKKLDAALEMSFPASDPIAL